MNFLVQYLSKTAFDVRTFASSRNRLADYILQPSLRGRDTFLEAIRGQDASDFQECPC
jgi:hypothetical protein